MGMIMVTQLLMTMQMLLGILTMNMHMGMLMTMFMAVYHISMTMLMGMDIPDEEFVPPEAFWSMCI